MRFKLDTEIKPTEWLYIGAAFILIILTLSGKSSSAICAVTEWIKALIGKK